MIKDVAKWLKSAPRKNEIVEIQNGNKKVKIIKQKIIESLLDELTDQNWSTRNFKFSRSSQKIQIANPKIPSGTIPSGTGYVYDIVDKVMCDASLELVVTYRVLVPAPLQIGTGPISVEKEITRVLVGSYSFDVSRFGNDFVANTAKSLCISNAASDLGRRFGKDLNPDEPSILLAGAEKPIDLNTEVKNKISESLDKIKNSVK